MDFQCTAESGDQLLARLGNVNRPSLHNLDNILFPEGPNPCDVIQISGETSVGKTMILMKFLSKCILLKEYQGTEIGGLDAGVILIDTDHNISMLTLVTMMKESIPSVSGNRAEFTEKIITESLKNLIILKTYSREQFEMNLYSLERILYKNGKISMLMIDSIVPYYWSDRFSLNSIKKMDHYLNQMVDKIQKLIKTYKLVVIYAKQGYFKSKKPLKSNCEYPNYKIELKKSGNAAEGLFCASIMPSNSVYTYSINEKGFTWIIQ